MGFREFLSELRSSGELIIITKPISKNFELANILYKFDGKPVLFENIKESNYKVVGNLFSSRSLISKYFQIPEKELLLKIVKAIEEPSEPELIKNPPCQEVIEESIELSKLPILFHFRGDGGAYISAGVVVVKDKELGRNSSFHRGMVISENRLAIRICERHLAAFLKRNDGELDAAICIGNPINFLLSAATSLELGFDEMKMANSLEPIEIAKCLSIDVEIPAHTEIVLEGRIIKERAQEGKFLDLTGTYDIEREQPIFEVKRLTHRKDAIYQALLPGFSEHRLLMGLPREPTIYREVNKVCKCKDVYLTQGGCSWLHAVVQIKKEKEDDGKNAIKSAFKGHSSLKHVIVVDEDIDIRNSEEAEWALATRFQAHRGLIMKKEKGSSLDPSADPITHETSKLGFDATAPLGTKGKEFKKPKFHFSQ